MKESEKQVLRDLQGFIEWGIKHNKDFGWILGNVGHDVNGLLSKQKPFSPRTYGYEAVMKEIMKAK